MQTIRVGNRIQFHFEDEPKGKPTIGTVCKVLTDLQEGLGEEVEAYAAGWLGIRVLIQDSLEKGSELVNHSSATLQGIVASVKRVTDIGGEIAAASSKQSTRVDCE